MIPINPVMMPIPCPKVILSLITIHTAIAVVAGCAALITAALIAVVK